MDRKLLFISLFLICSGCAGGGPDQLSDLDQARIRQEVAQAFQAIMQNSKDANLAAALRFYRNAPDFVGIFGDGTMNDFEAFQKANREYFDKVAGQEITTLKEKIVILSKDVAVYAWQGKITVNLKNDAILKMNPFAITLVFRRIGDQWKVIYSHESSLPPVESATAKK